MASWIPEQEIIFSETKYSKQINEKIQQNRKKDRLRMSQPVEIIAVKVNPAKHTVNSQ